MSLLYEDCKKPLLALVILFSFLGCSSMTHMRDGDSYAMQGNWHQAYDSYSKGLDASPDNIELRIKT